MPFPPVVLLSFLMGNQPELSEFYRGGDSDGLGWQRASQTDDDATSLKSKVLKASSSALKGLSQPSADTPQPMVQSAPPPAPYTPDTSGISEMGSQMTPRMRPNPRLQQAMLEA